MSTQKLTAFQIRSKHGLNNRILLPVDAIDRAMEEYAAQQVRDMQAERDKALDERRGDNIHHVDQNN